MLLRLQCVPPLWSRLQRFGDATKGVAHTGASGAWQCVPPLWSRLQRFADRARDFVVANLAWCAGPWLVVETVHSSLGKAVPPSADRVRADAKLRGDLFVLQAASRRQHNARPLGQCLR